MDIKKLLSGIAVVIDDKLNNGEQDSDIINPVIEWFEKKWQIHFIKKKNLEDDNILCSNLLTFVSFILLDWNFWEANGDNLKKYHIERIKKFLECTSKHLVPVIILTNEDSDDIKNELIGSIGSNFNTSNPSSSFIIIESKTEFWIKNENKVKLDTIENWLSKNPSIYALKTWNYELHKAKNEMFKAMYNRNVNWPKVFWKNYNSDGVDPSLSLTELISSNMLGRMNKNAFESNYLKTDSEEDISSSQLIELISESSFIKAEDLSESEIRCGDLFKVKSNEFLLNLRPDCDCVPRRNKKIEEIEVYCIEGKKITQNKLNESYNEELEAFTESIDNAYVFGTEDGKIIDFRFKKLKILKYEGIKEKRIGRLIHPYITRIQQRFGLYIQRQGLPKIPKEAVNKMKST